METKTIYANIFATMTTKLSNMKAAGIINDYDVDCVIRDWHSEGEEEQDYNYIKVHVNQFAFNKEKLNLEFSAEHPYSLEEYNAFYKSLDGIIESVINHVKAKLDEAQSEYNLLRASLDASLKPKEE